MASSTWTGRLSGIEHHINFSKNMYLNLFLALGYTMEVGIYRKEFKMDTNELARPASWGETLLALETFLLFPLVFLLGAILTPFIKKPLDPDLALGITFGVLGILLNRLGGRLG